MSSASESSDQLDQVKPKIRRVRRKDGRIEVQRILTVDGLAARSLSDPLTFERCIVWISEEVEEYSFVREATIHGAKSRRSPLHLPSGRRVVGYAKLTNDAPVNDRGTYTRRVFYLKDKDNPHTDAPPQNAVKPSQIKPGVQAKYL